MRSSIIANVCMCLMLVTGKGNADPVDSKPFSCEPHSVKELLDLLGDQQVLAEQPQQALDAMNCLGSKMRPEGIPVLVKLLTWRYTFPFEITGGAVVISFGINTGNRYPATNALAEIGKPALPALLKVIETNPVDSLRAKNARFTVHTIVGHDGPAREEAFFQDAASKASTPEAKDRLLRALKTAREDYKSD